MSRSFVVKWSKCNLYNHLRNKAVQGLYGHNKQWYSYYFSQMLYQSIDVKRPLSGVLALSHVKWM